jgi:hypothetical protein
MSTKKSTKKRNWAFVLYPESAPADWLERLKLSGLMGAVSPLHDKDINADGEPKKAHYHIILVYAGPTSFNVVNALCESLNQPIPQPLESVRGYYRYLTHKDNPEKFQYSDSDIVTFGGFDYRDYVEMTRSEVLKCIRAVQALIRDNDISEYSDLLDLLDDNDMTEEYDVASSHTMLFGKYIDSRRNKKALKFKAVSDE